MSTAAKHTFTYYDDVATAGGGFAAAAKWDGVKDGLNAGHQIDRASTLGMSETNGGDGRVYIGFNPTSPTKTGSFGGSITFNGGRTESLIEFTDINGDALPDKIFRSGNQIKYRLNTSKPGDALSKAITFSTADDGDASTTDGVIANLTKFPPRRSSGSPGGSRRTSASSASSTSGAPGASRTATSPTRTATASSISSRAARALQPPRLLAQRRQARQCGQVHPDVQRAEHGHPRTADRRSVAVRRRLRGADAADAARASATSRHGAPVGRAVLGKHHHWRDREAPRGTPAPRHGGDSAGPRGRSVQRP